MIRILILLILASSLEAAEPVETPYDLKVFKWGLSEKEILQISPQLAVETTDSGTRILRDKKRIWRKAELGTNFVFDKADSLRSIQMVVRKRDEDIELVADRLETHFLAHLGVPAEVGKGTYGNRRLVWSGPDYHLNLIFAPKEHFRHDILTLVFSVPKLDSK